MGKFLVNFNKSCTPLLLLFTYGFWIDLNIAWDIGFVFIIANGRIVLVRC